MAVKRFNDTRNQSIIIPVSKSQGMETACGLIDIPAQIT